MFGQVATMEPPRDACALLTAFAKNYMPILADVNKNKARPEAEPPGELFLR